MRSLSPLPLRPIYAYVLAVISGLLYWLAFPGQNVWPIGFFAFTPFLFAIYKQPSKQAAFAGLMTGTTLNLFGFSWLFETIRFFGGFPAPLSLFFMVALCMYQGLRMALMAFIFARVTCAFRHHASTHSSFKQLAYGPALLFSFACSEYIFPVLFPWYFGATLYRQPLFTQTADLGGPILVGLSLLLPSLVLTEFILSKMEHRTLHKRSVIFFCSLFFGYITYGAWRITDVDAHARASKPVLVGLVQGVTPLLQHLPDQKGDGFDIDASLPKDSLLRQKKLTRDLKEKGVDFVVWSENSVLFGADELHYREQYKRTVTGGLDVPIIFGGLIYRRHLGRQREKFFNTALASDREGNIVSRYDKHFLLAFGEYLPFGDMFPALYDYSPNSGRFASGESLDPLFITTQGESHKVGPLICYEDILPAFTNDIVNHSKPELLVNITNDTWFGKSVEPVEHLALSTFRAIEHRRYFVRATNSGISALVDPVGRIMIQSTLFKAESLQGEVKWMDGSTVFEYVGDKLWIGLSLGIAYFMLMTSPWFRGRWSRGFKA